MCNLYSLSDDQVSIAAAFGAVVRGELTWKPVVAPLAPAPTVIASESGRVLTEMAFGLGDRRRPLNNARWENLAARCWKPVLTQRCVLPVNKFREPLYWGDDAGTQAYFQPVDQSLLAVAGLYSHGRMSFIMRPACDYVMKYGHHRQPFFLELDAVDDWLAPGNLELDEVCRLLRRAAAEPDWEHVVDAEMKPAWKSRAKGHFAKRDEQLAAVEEHGPLGM